MNIEKRILKILARGFQDVKEGETYYKNTLPRLVKLFSKTQKKK